MSDTITITGNIAADPEHKLTSSGLAITTFRVGSSQRRYDRASGQWVETATNWYTVSAFRGLAEHAVQSLRKGDRVIVTGRLRVRQWETATAKGTAVEIDADAIGHDLLWGTTTFVKGARPAAAETSWATAAVPDDDHPSSVVSDAADASTQPTQDWTVPGAEATRSGELVGTATPF